MPIQRGSHAYTITTLFKPFARILPITKYGTVQDTCPVYLSVLWTDRIQYIYFQAGKTEYQPGTETANKPHLER